MDPYPDFGIASTINRRSVLLPLTGLLVLIMLGELLARLVGFDGLKSNVGQNIESLKS